MKTKSKHCTNPACENFGETRAYSAEQVGCDLCGRDSLYDGEAPVLFEIPARDEPDPLFSRRGRFSIRREFFKKHPEAVMRVMGRCAVFRAELMWETDSFEYLAVSADFEEVEDGLPPFEYEACFMDTPDGMDFAWFRRCGG